MTGSPRWCYQSIRSNTELNACGILASSNIPNEAMLETFCDKCTKNSSKKGVQVDTGSRRHCTLKSQFANS